MNPFRNHWKAWMLAGLLLAGAYSSVKGEVPADTGKTGSGLDAVDALYLARVGEALVLSRSVAEKLWPKWGLEKTPILIFEPNRIAYLINHPRPPRDFKQLPEKIPLLGSVFMKEGRDLRFTANTTMDLGGIPTATISFSTAPSSGESPSIRFIALIFHEAFHAFQATAAQTEKGSVEAVLLHYPDFNASNFALAQLEQLILYDLVFRHDAPDPEGVKRFVAVRAARGRLLGAEFLKAERGIEYQEGIPTYLEVRLVEEARHLATTNVKTDKADPYSLSSALAPEAVVSEYYSHLHQFSIDTGSIRRRAYYTGMALALILDRMRVPWKKELLEGEAYLDEILARQISLSDDARSKLLSQAKTEYGYDPILNLTRAKLNRLRDERLRAADLFLQQQGLRVDLWLPEHQPVELRNFDPLNLQVIDNNRTIHKRVLSLAAGDSRFQASGVPILVHQGKGPFDVRGLTFFVLREDLELDLDLIPFEPEPGSYDFGSLDLSTREVSLRSTAGQITVSPDRQKLEIRLER